MQVIGGLAFVNQVTFFSRRFRVTARASKDRILVSYHRSSGNRAGKLYDIPVVRGLVRIFTLLLGTKVTWILLAGLAAVDISLTLLFDFNNQFLGVSWPIFGLFTPVDLILFPLVVIFIKHFVGKSHGAEHKVFNTWLKGKEITFENVNSASRVSARCGTNLVVFIILLNLPLALFLPAYITPLLSVALGYELFKSNNKIIRGISRFLCKIGGVLQYLLFTSEPTEKELNLAIKAFNKLVELESI
ncbi:DUF1385 domain-containing protein [Metallumcola ferriviriculae]|uniref:DUF1385 domain-containing protein n=1 Tax=Metallumcola ferriviriculae TaxID=3039180 RepID=A0AAU0UJS8_9FIRM|nr:DUF1385 domain-containing protein [Desulfitibacteraceae bacterium MK1]